MQELVKISEPLPTSDDVVMVVQRSRRVEVCRPQIYIELDREPLLRCL